MLNKDGKPIFFALDTTDAWASTVFEGTKPFNVMILNYDYAEVLKIIGPGLSRLRGVRFIIPSELKTFLKSYETMNKFSVQNLQSALVKHSGKPIGRVVQEDHLCSFTPTYLVEGVNGITGLKVVVCNMHALINV